MCNETIPVLQDASLINTTHTDFKEFNPPTEEATIYRHSLNNKLYVWVHMTFQEVDLIYLFSRHSLLPSKFMVCVYTLLCQIACIQLC